ncbi:hypothetical protein [Planococcus glaciei]|jgi:hypothetical protein|uniref:Uncharacterized protein n=1 Tax=Planococcus glaciei TaxID=459472 RepID=A0A1G8EV80_9BACL|nr:hypothetical protein [Planococcus glaciei]ETP68584.1 hypothetical protein G159_11815 [Planococcus glaciei CHR43]MBX0313569.1 hypothetical protein [Planococcus glaciei]QKX49282.1 hypothetical protein HF394_01100 [Planococcus glaciei]SDH73770.1 hypothetical protein SAMN04487975_107125 [Planococcus glaciei]
MNKQANWWEPIFSGELEVGLNKEKLDSLEQESFLYFDETQIDMETHA